MPSFLKDLSLRRRSRVSVKTTTTTTTTEPDPVTSSNSSSGDGEPIPRRPSAGNKSSSTLNSYADRPSPPTTLDSQTSKSSGYLPSLLRNGKKTPPMPSDRPNLNSANSNRYSLVGQPMQNGQQSRPSPATSPYAPRVLSVSDGSWVHQKVLLIYGQAADVERPVDGQLTVYHHQDKFPSTQWPVCDSHFKALVYLHPGPNKLRLEFTSSALLASTNGQMQQHVSWININYLALVDSPPLHLCILLAKDSPRTFDSTPDRKMREGNGLDTAIRKFRMAAYLWQAFTAEQMNRNGFGRRCYRYEEEWQASTLSVQDMQTGTMRNESKIHVITLDKTVGEIRDLAVSQQYEPATQKGKLYEFAADAVKKYFGPSRGHKRYVSCMFLDTHWDKAVGTIRGHAALGGGDGELGLAIFGSHCLYAYPSHLEEVVPAFSDCTRTDTNFVANDCNEAGSSWEAANIGIGAHLHETGHLLGCPHQESGVMLRDYVTLNRTFTCREPYSTRTRQQGMRLCLPKDECTWHRLDTLRFRFHPCFQLPADPTLHPDTSVQVWAVDNGTVLATAATGIAWIEFLPGGGGGGGDDDLCHHWIEYIDPSNTASGPPRQVSITEQTINEQISARKPKRNLPLKIKIFSAGGGEFTVANFAHLASNEGKIKLPDGRPGFKSAKLGFSQMDGSQPQHMWLMSAMKSPKLLKNVRVYHGQSLDGLEFFYEGGDSELFGKRGGKRGGSNFAIDAQRAETLIGFYVRAGVWIDGIQLITSTGRRSEIYGNATGGSGHMLIPPRGYALAGIYGSCGAWVDGFGLIISR